MQWILGIDFSARPVEATIAKVDGSLVDVQFRRELDAGILDDLSTLASEDLERLMPKPSQNGNSESPADHEALPEGEALKRRLVDCINGMRNALTSFDAGWTACVVTVPPFRNLAINLNLPFGDSKNINRIVDLEVQDVIPFDLDEFLLQYSALGSWTKAPSTAIQSVNGAADSSGYDVHVSLLPRLFVKNVLGLCRAAGIEPNVLTTPSSAISAVYHVAKEYFRGNSAVLMIRQNEYSLAIFVGGQVRVERCFQASDIEGGPSTSEEDRQRHIFAALKLMIASVERRYDTRIETVHVLGKGIRIPLLQQTLARPVEPFELKDVMRYSDPATGIGALASVFVREEDPPPILSNFRTREFSYSPKLGEFLRTIASTWRYMAAAAAAVTIAVVGYYAAQQYRLSSMESALTAQIRTIIPDFDPAGDVRGALAKAESKLSEDLGVLGSPAKVTPLDALIEINKSLASMTSVTIQSVKINGQRATVTGIAPKVSIIEQVQKELKNNKNAFSKVTANPGPSSGSNYTFTIDIVLAQ